MNLIFGVTVIVLLSIFALIAAHVRYPQSAILQTAKEWQTLIGAILGFSFLSGSVVISEEYRHQAERKKSIADEIAHAQMLALELDYLRGDIRISLELLPPRSHQIDAEECSKIVERLQSRAIEPFAIEDRMSAMVESLSPEFLRIVTLSASIRRESFSRFDRIPTDVCANEPVELIDEVRAQHGRDLDMVSRMQAVIETYIDVISGSS